MQSNGTVGSQQLTDGGRTQGAEGQATVTREVVSSVSQPMRDSGQLASGEEQWVVFREDYLAEPLREDAVGPASPVCTSTALGNVISKCW